MKKIITLTFIISLVLSLQLSAQLRSNLASSYDYSGPIVNTESPTIQTWLDNFFSNKVEMSHSYSMSVGSIGGSFQNINAYTNTLNFQFTNDFTGRLDVSFLHSPFGNNNLMNSNQNGLGGEVIIQNAELNYKINDNAHIRFQYQQLPSSYGLFSPFGNNRFNRYSPWY